MLAQLVEQLKADASFLRRNDHGLRASVLVQARIAAEERLQCLVEHDDLTALHNALIAYLCKRLAAGRPAPVSVLYSDGIGGTVGRSRGSAHAES